MILEAAEITGEPGGVTQEDLDEGHLNDEKIQAICGMSLEEAKSEYWEYVVAVGRGIDLFSSHQEIADDLYTSLKGDSFKLVC